MKIITHKWSAEHRGLVIAGISLLVFGCLLCATLYSARVANLQRQQSQAEYIHTFRVLVVAEQLKSAVNAALRGERGYLLTQNRLFLKPFENGRIDIARFSKQLATITADNPVQLAHSTELREAIDSYMGVLEHTIRLTGVGQIDEAIGIVASGQGRLRIERVLSILTKMENEERRLLALRGTKNAAAEDKIAYYDFAMALLGLIFVAIAGFSAWIAHRSESRAHYAADILQHLAMTDSLTGIANRRAFFEALEREVKYSTHRAQPMTLAVLDIDYFKRINDAHGHPAGDDVLQVAAKMAQDVMRTADLVGRVGGEEFAVLMPQTSAYEAFLACERLRIALERRAIVLPSGSSLSITLSMGLATLLPEENVDSLFVRADAALYAAKAGGRNQIRLAA